MEEELQKEDIESYFQIGEKELENANILFAFYDRENHEGRAYVLFEKNGELYEVYGSHCSCRGLEGQWEPEKSSVEAVRHFLSVGAIPSVRREEIDKVLAVLDK